jgi:hypothetical protein
VSIYCGNALHLHVGGRDLSQVSLGLAITLCISFSLNTVTTVPFQVLNHSAFGIILTDHVEFGYLGSNLDRDTGHPD